MKLVIIGAGTAGTELARRVRFFDKSASIILVDKIGASQFSPCSLPYFIEGAMSDVSVYDSYEADGIIYERGFEVKYLEYKNDAKEITISKGDEEKKYSFDFLVIATGSNPIIPTIEGVSDFLILKTLDDAEKIKKITGSVLLIGGGYIGCEIAAGLSTKCRVTLVEAESHILPFLEKDCSLIVKEHLENKGVIVIEGKKLTSLKESFLEEKSFDHIIYAVGSKPSLDILDKSTIPKKEISFEHSKRPFEIYEDIFAIGDCSQEKNLVTGLYEHNLFANTAVKQAEILSQVLIGNISKERGFIRNAISKIGAITVGTVGISKKDNSSLVVGKHDGFDAYKTCGGKRVYFKLYCTKEGHIKGCQAIGDGEIAGKLDLVSALIRFNKTIYDLLDIDYCYNPCVAGMHNPLFEAAKICAKKCNSLRK